MNKQVTIYDYNKKPSHIIIDNFEEVRCIFCEVISGDEVLTVFYIDNTRKEFDSSFGNRTIDFFDGSVVIPVDKIDDLSTIPDSSEMLEHYMKLEELRNG